MNYSLHWRLSGDLQNASSFYREKPEGLSQSFFGVFEQSINRVLLHPALRSPSADGDDAVFELILGSRGF
jgi:hypothetical protein